MYEYNQQPKTEIAENSVEVYQTIKTAPLSVLCGPNNCGKSFLLKKMVTELGNNASYLGPARYQNFHLLSHFSPNRNRKVEKWRSLLQHIQNVNQNIDNSPINLAQAIAELNNDQRQILIQIMYDLLGSKMEIRYTVPENDMSQKYIGVDGHNISYTSSGYRLVATLITSLLDTDYTHYLIDEPELGISPAIQSIVAEFLYNAEKRKEYFPHIISITVATHSPIFLDRLSIRNNYHVGMNNNVIHIDPIDTVQKLNSLQFFLLGNRFETMFLPSAIILVEGKCDYDYVSKVVALKYPEASISLIQTNGDNRIRDSIHIAKQMFFDLRKSPYCDRIFVVLDSVHTRGLKEHLIKMGVAEENIIIWSKNGIEFYYPQEILENIFGKFEELNISDDEISANGIIYKKNELKELVVRKLTGREKYPNEFTVEFLEKLDAKLF